MTEHRSAGEGTQQHDDATAEPMTSARLLSIMQTERAEWEALLAQVGEERMDTPGVDGQWSVKDIVAHLTWYDRTVVEGAQTVMRGEPYVRTGLRALGMDERNERIAAESRDRPLRDVLADSRQVFDQVLAVVRACPGRRAERWAPVRAAGRRAAMGSRGEQYLRALSGTRSRHTGMAGSTIRYPIGQTRRTRKSPTYGPWRCRRSASTSTH